MPRSKSQSENRRRSLSDPLSRVLRPPPNETPVEREKRVKAEQQAKKVSDDIDDLLIAERQEQRRRKEVVKVLLLGQSESGKSTTLKQFQLLHTPAAFRAERLAWRLVIYLNLVRSIRRILEVITPDGDTNSDADEHDQERDSYHDRDDDDVIIVSAANSNPPNPHLPSTVANASSIYDTYRHRLAPLLPLEERLIRMLSSPEEDEATHLGTDAHSYTHLHSHSSTGNIPDSHSHSTTPTANTSTSGNTTGTHNTHTNGRPTLTIGVPSDPTSSPVSPLSASSSVSSTEISVRTTSNWRKALSLGGKVRSPKSAHTGELVGWWEDATDPVHMLNSCAGAMLDLWKDERVRAKLRERRVRLEESSGFYLDEIDRITAKKYIPTDDDVLKARLKTMGVVEHSFILTKGNERGVEWKIYDVGGARNQRQAWAPYFDDVNAIIFLAPISAFDQVLAEDPKVNRLEDTLQLWKSLVSDKLLADVNIVLFLNKCDLLEKKLNAGVRLNQHMVSYGDRPNDYESVSRYFYNKFGVLHQACSPNPQRELHIHLTCVTDTRKTSSVILNVRDIILRGHLKDSKLI